MSGALIDRALTVERCALKCLDGLAEVTEVRDALLLLRGTINAGAFHAGAMAVDHNGRPWAERIDSLERNVRVARDPEQLEAALRVILADLEPLTGSVRQDANEFVC